jgi:hypothetical protein
MLYLAASLALSGVLILTLKMERAAVGDRAQRASVASR